MLLHQIKIKYPTTDKYRDCEPFIFQLISYLFGYYEFVFAETSFMKINRNEQNSFPLILNLWLEAQFLKEKFITAQLHVIDWGFEQTTSKQNKF